MPNSQSITRLTNDQRDRMARLLTEADIPVNNDDSIPLGDIIPVSRRNIKFILKLFCLTIFIRWLYFWIVGTYNLCHTGTPK